MNFLFPSRARRKASDRSGFTLIEVMISMTMLAFISLAIYQATTSSFRLREKLLGTGDFQNSIRLSIGILDRDFAVVYSPVLMKPEPIPSASSSTDPNQDSGGGAIREMEELTTGELGRSTKFWGGAADLNGLRPSRFQGNATSMSFLSASHQRIYKEARETELAAVSYTLEDDRMPGAIEGTRMLVRTIDPAIYSETLGERESKTERKYPLIRGISKMELKYWHPEKKDWERSWDSDSSDTKNLYPTMLQITLEVKGPMNTTFDGQWTLRTEVPLRGLATTF